MYESLIKELKLLQDPAKASFHAKYFKTGKGEYGEGDVFLGITVPEQRKVALKFRDMSFTDVGRLIKSSIHEHRFVALEILVAKYEKTGNDSEKKKIFDFYISQKKYINNWDLVDTSARYIVGDYLEDKEKDILYRMTLSKNVWERRIAIVSTHHFISNGSYGETIKIAELLLNDEHDLIHKAVGWMLREVGNKSLETEVKFLKKHHKIMPRTMLHYAVEKFPKEQRILYYNS